MNAFRVHRLFAVLTLLGSVIHAQVQTAPPGMAVIPGGVYYPAFVSAAEPKSLPVSPFLLDVAPVSNAEFLDFVREHPQWRRSQVKRLFADESYLKSWASDLEPGSNAPLRAAVTDVSWFAAKAFAAAQGKRLPALAEWEYAASAGFTLADGHKDAVFKTSVFEWYASAAGNTKRPTDEGRANFWGIRNLHGLVWEWVSDFNISMVTGDARGDAGPDRALFCGAGALTARDLEDYPAFMRNAFRSSLRASYCVHNLGFRCAKDL